MADFLSKKIFFHNFIHDKKNCADEKIRNLFSSSIKIRIFGCADATTIGNKEENNKIT